MTEQNATNNSDAISHPFEILLLNATQLLSEQMSRLLIDNSGCFATKEQFDSLFESFNKLVPLYNIVFLLEFIRTTRQNQVMPD